MRAAALRSILPMVGNPCDDFAADTVWMARQALVGDLLRVPEVLYRKRYHTTNTHTQWFGWPPEFRIRAWITHCLDMLAEALKATGVASERRVLHEAARTRLLRPRTWTPYGADLERLGRLERVRLRLSFDAAAAIRPDIGRFGAGTIEKLKELFDGDKRDICDISLTRKQELYLDELVEQVDRGQVVSVGETARKLHIARQTMSRWHADPTFRAAASKILRESNNELWDHRVDRAVDRRAIPGSSSVMEDRSRKEPKPGAVEDLPGCPGGVVRNNAGGPNLGEFIAPRHVGHGRSWHFGDVAAERIHRVGSGDHGPISLPRSASNRPAHCV